MQKKYLGIILLLIVSLTIVGCATTNEESSPTQIPPITSTDSRVIVDGVLRPIKDVELAFGASARIATINVEEGQSVQQGRSVSKPCEYRNLSCRTRKCQISACPSPK